MVVKTAIFAFDGGELREDVFHEVPVYHFTEFFGEVDKYFIEFFGG